MWKYIQKFTGLFLATFLLTISSVIAQIPTFTWMSGDEVWNQGPNNVSISTGIYGTKTSPAVVNSVGSRQGSLSWKDASGNLWLFGGFGRDKNSSTGHLNDLWRYNPSTNLWTWIKGSEFIRQGSVYGTKGTPSPNNTPGARAYSVTWTDANGDLWLFGGIGYDQAGVTLRNLNDLWKFNVSTNQWTWMSGSDVANRIGIYGTKGTADSDNVPGSRQYSISWADANGNLWLFGGTGFDKNGAQGHLNDLWKYNIASNRWTWVSGSDRVYQNVYQNNIYGTKGTPSVNNIPSARYSSVSWIDANGNLMLFGGYGTDKNGSWGSLNDLWRFNSTSNEWTWVNGSDIINQVGIYGTKGTASANNIPGARRESVSWKDNAGTLWLFGGVGIDKAGVSGYLNDLWKYNSATNQWTWVGGGDLVNRIGTIGTKQTASANNIPSSRSRSNSWVDPSGNLWVFGGFGLDANSSYGYLNNLWKYNISTNQWTWVNGSEYVNQNGNYGTKGDPLYDINIAGARQHSASWTDANGDYWFFGGQGRDKNGVLGYLNDLWKYNKTDKEWIWVSGSDIINQNGVYGTMGVPSSGNVPGARINSVTWIDASGNLWLYGGQGRDRNASTGYLNDLWRYNPSTNLWTWIKGSDLIHPNGVYGIKGTASSSNIPGGRVGSVSFKDANGFLWLFGGYGRDKNGSFGYLNDLWKYNISTNVWTWVSGDDINNQSAAYGSKGVSSLSNKPGARQYAVGSIDGNDNIWLYGGTGYDQNGSQGHLNDLWKYQIATNRWTWISGNSELNQNGVYGTKGVSSTNNISGARYAANFFTDNSGNLWLLGGIGRDKNGSFGYLNDLWNFKVATNEWTWVQGSDIVNQAGIYGTKGISSNNNVPGSRTFSSILKDFDGNLILFGGLGYDATGSSSYLNDLWKFDLVTKQWTWLSGNDVYQKAGVYGNKGVSSSNNLPGARQLPISWTDNDGYLWLFGGIGYDKNGRSGYLNDLWVYSSGSNEWKWVSGSENVNQIGVYGTKGAASVNNLPGARRGSSSWVDKAGNLWLFGGYGYDKNGSFGYLNDVWRYNLLTKEWTWMSGSDVANQNAIYGTLGLAATSNIPGARQYATNWVDSSTNTLWLYGGQGYIEDGALGSLNDLWKYNMSTNVWTWVSGSKAINQNGVYGSKGIAANSNIPGARYYAQAWLGENGKLLLFGGQGYDKNASLSALNDFWSYNINTNQWTWIGGGDILGKNGVYGSKGISAVNNIPGGRYQSNAWKDSKNNLWLFGGIGRDKNGSQSYLNDLWKYNPVNNQWTWISGSDIFGQFGVYGTKELPSINNIPGARIGGAGWKDATGNFWVYGGTGYDKNGTTGYLNDMWGIAICDNFNKPIFDVNKKIVCLTDTVSLSISNKKDGDLFSWFYSNESDSTSNEFSKKFTDTMNVYVLKANPLGCGIISSDTLRINRTPVAPIIIKSTNQTLLASSNNLTWYRNAIKLLDTTQRILPDSNGVYSVITTQLGCESLKSANVLFILVPSLDSIKPGNRLDTLSWSVKDVSNLKYFKIYRDTVSSPTKLLDSVSGNVRRYIDTISLQNNKKYFYRIVAGNQQNNESDFSNVLNVIPFNSLPKPVKLANRTVQNAGEYNFIKLTYSASGSFDTDGKIASYNWYVNDSLVNKTDSILSYTYKLGSHAIKLIVIDNDGGKDSSISLLNISSLQKVFPAGILGGISAINSNYILTADTSFNNTTGSSVLILDRSGNTIFPIVVQSKIFTTPSISSDTSIFITNGSSLNGYSKSGVSLWPTIPLGGISYVTPTIDSNFSRIYVGVSNKNFFAYDYKTGKNVWSIICDAPINTSAVITGDRKLIFTSQAGTLYGFDISKSDIQITPKWKMSFGDTITKSPAIDASSNIYVGTNAGRLIKFMLNTDGSVSVKWNVSLGSAIQTSPVIDADSNIYVGTEKGDFYKINRSSGSTIWSYNVGAAIYSTPNISEYGTIYVSNMNGLVTAISTDKRVLWKYQDIGAISANSLYINNMLYVASEKGTFTGIYDNPNSVNVNTTISSSGNAILSSLDSISTTKTLNTSSTNNSTSTNLITPRKPVWGTFQGDFRRSGSLSLICPSSLSISRSNNGSLISNTPNYIQWYKDGSEVPNATDSIFKPTLAGNYFIKNNQAGCNTVASNSYYYLVTDIVNLNKDEFIKLTPNPFINFMNIDFVVKGYQRMNIEVFSASTGAKMAVRIGVTAGSRLTFNELNPGIYFVRVASSDLKIAHQFKMVKL